MTTDTDDDDIDRNNRSKMVARWGGWLHARWACQGNKVKASTVLANDLGLNPKSRHGCILAELMHRGPRAKWLRSHTMDAARAANFYLDHDTYLDHALSSASAGQPQRAARLRARHAVQRRAGYQ